MNSLRSGYRLEHLWHLQEVPVVRNNLGSSVQPTISHFQTNFKIPREAPVLPRVAELYCKTQSTREYILLFIQSISTLLDNHTRNVPHLPWGQHSYSVLEVTGPQMLRKQTPRPKSEMANSSLSPLSYFSSQPGGASAKTDPEPLFHAG